MVHIANILKLVIEIEGCKSRSIVLCKGWAVGDASEEPVPVAKFGKWPIPERV